MDHDFDTIYKENESYVKGLCVRFLGPNYLNELEDVCQIVWMTLHESLPYFRGDCSLRTWLYWICRSKINNYLNSRTREFKGTPAYLNSRLTDFDIDLSAPESQMIMEEMIDAVDFDDEKVSLVLEWVNTTQSYDALAEKYDVPTGTIRSRINRGRRNLHKSLDSLEKPEKPKELSAEDIDVIRKHTEYNATEMAQLIGVSARKIREIRKAARRV